MTVCVLGIFLRYLRLRTNIEKVLRDSQRPLTMITLRSVDVWPCHKPLLLFHLYILSHSGSNKERPVWCWMLMLCLEWEKRNVQCVWRMNFMRRTIWPEHMGNYIWNCEVFQNYLHRYYYYYYSFSSFVEKTYCLARSKSLGMNAYEVNS